MAPGACSREPVGTSSCPTGRLVGATFGSCPSSTMQSCQAQRSSADEDGRDTVTLSSWEGNCISIELGRGRLPPESIIPAVRAKDAGMVTSHGCGELTSPCRGPGTSASCSSSGRAPWAPGTDQGSLGRGACGRAGRCCWARGQGWALPWCLPSSKVQSPRAQRWGGHSSNTGFSLQEAH